MSSTVSNTTKNTKDNRKVVAAKYYCEGVFKIPDGIDLEDRSVVKEWCVKWIYLHILYVDGSNARLEAEWDIEPCWQYPEVDIKDAEDYNIEYSGDEEEDEDEEENEEDECSTCGKKLDGEDKCSVGCPEYDAGWAETHLPQENEEDVCSICGKRLDAESNVEELHILRSVCAGLISAKVLSTQPQISCRTCARRIFEYEQEEEGFEVDKETGEKFNMQRFQKEKE